MRLSTKCKRVARSITDANQKKVAMKYLELALRELKTRYYNALKFSEAFICIQELENEIDVIEDLIAEL